MDPGLARLTRRLPATTRRWLGAPPGYNFFPWQGQNVDSPRGVTGTSDVGPPLVPPIVTKTDISVWDTWTAGPGLIGSTYNVPLYHDDVLYVSYGSAWVNIVWTSIKVGDIFQIKSQDGTRLFVEYAATTGFSPGGSGGSVSVSSTGGPLDSPGVGTTVQVVLTPA